MSIWNYIGEFFLFRWLFDKFKKSTTEHGAPTEVIGTPIDINSEYLNDNHDGDIASIDGATTSVGDNLLNDSDNSGDLDDLDRFMLDNNANNHYREYGDDYLYSNHNDWDSENYDESYDDFLNEQDDYDMMDDDFYDEQDDYDMLDDDF